VLGIRSPKRHPEQPLPAVLRSPAMQTRKREFWNNAEPERLPDAWRMTKVKGDHTMTAVCEVWAVEARLGSPPHD
jgi:hypothetical protein